jgi:hypothetical protein
LVFHSLKSRDTKEDPGLKVEGQLLGQMGASRFVRFEGFEVKR